MEDYYMDELPTVIEKLSAYKYGSTESKDDIDVTDLMDLMG
jgi:hypothetical protein